MSATINRRIRRIGLLPTTFKEVVEGERKVKKGSEESIERIIKRIPIRHSTLLTPEEREAIAVKLRAEHRERHMKFRAARKAGFPKAA